MRTLILDTIKADGNGYRSISGRLILDVEIGENGYNTIDNIDQKTIAAIAVGALKCEESLRKDITVYMNDDNSITTDMVDR